MVFALSAHAGPILIDFSTGDGGFASSGSPANLWNYSGTAWVLTGQNNADARLTSPTFTATGGEVVLQFVHSYNFESAFDGGNVELSLNGGAFSPIPAGNFTQNGYTGSDLLNSFVEDGFNGSSGGQQTSITSLGFLVDGDEFAFRFRAGYDASVINQGTAWTINSVEFSGAQSGEIPEPSTAGLLALGGLGLALLRRRVVRTNRHVA
jgi:hypothetical protein